MSFISTDSERRKFKRTELDVPVRYKFKNSKEFGSTLSRDISEGGVRLSVDKFVPVNTDVVLELGLGKLSNMINAVAKVAWTNFIPFSDRYQLGLEFYEINCQNQKDISDYVNSRRF